MLAPASDPRKWSKSSRFDKQAGTQAPGQADTAIACQPGRRLRASRRDGQPSRPKRKHGRAAEHARETI